MRARARGGDPGLAQDREFLGGKILRLTPEGEPAPRQPPGRTPPSIPMATAMCRASPGTLDKRLWASEFGQDTWDELNLIRPGKNYGWPSRGQVWQGVFSPTR